MSLSRIVASFDSAIASFSQFFLASLVQVFWRPIEGQDRLSGAIIGPAAQRPTSETLLRSEVEAWPFGSWLVFQKTLCNSEDFEFTASNKDKTLSVVSWFWLVDETFVSNASRDPRNSEKVCTAKQKREILTSFSMPARHPCMRRQLQRSQLQPEDWLGGM